MDDRELLNRYTQTRSQAAFKELVDRHVDLVYSAALRQVRGDRHLAEDVTQAVFLILSQKAATLSPGTVLAGWLFNTARYAAANVLKEKSRRARREARKVEMDAPPTIDDPRKQENDSADWEKVGPLLDGALASLGSSDRDAVILRYMQGKSHQEVGGALGITSEAARKRIDRALDKLRGYLAHSGVTLSVAGLGTLLATQATVAAPVGLSGTIAASVGAGAGAVAAGASMGAPSIAEGTLSMIAWAKAKVAACVIGVVVAGTTGAVVVKQQIQNLQSNKPVSQLVAQPVAQVATPVNGAKPQAAPVPAQEQAITIEGVIKAPDETPAAGAEVFVAMPETEEQRARLRRRHAQIMAGQRPAQDDLHIKPTSVAVYDAQWPEGTQTADNTGHFSYSGLREPWILVVRHPSGYVQLTHEDFKKADRQIWLQPWGRVEGRLLVGKDPQPNQKIVLFRMGSAEEWDMMQVRHHRETKTDGEGNFTFENVAPGDSWLAWETRQPRFGRTRYMLLEVQPGKTLMQDLGGKGRPVIGRAARVPANAPDVTLSWDMERGKERASAMYHRVRDFSSYKQPPGFERMSRAEQLRFRRQWEKTPQGRESMRHQWAQDFQINPDGSFRIDDLEPGKYSIQLRILRTESGFGEDLVTCNKEFTVPDLPPGVTRLDEPLDLGTIPVELIPRARVGTVAPDFSATTLDGKTLKLSDYKGKFVMLKWFWSWNEMDVEAPALKKAYETMQRDGKGNWVLITIGFDKEIETARKRVTDHQLPGIHCHISDYHNSFPQGYMGSPSTVIIIGPDGKVLSRNIQPLNMETEVAKVMLENQ